MNKVDMLEEMKQEFQNLSYKDNTELDRLKRRLRMLITRLCGQTSNYLEDLNELQFTPRYGYSEMSESVAIEAWSSGKSSAINLIDTIIEEQNLFINEVLEEKVGVDKLGKDCSKVFIVHGHDDGAKNEVARFIEKLGFEAVILHEQVSSGATIIEKLEKHTDVGFAIVLYSACDIGAVKTSPEKLKPRARQNVVFEHGLLIGKIGRQNVVALVKDDVEIPSDISGVVYKTMDSKGAWKKEIADEMIESGYDVDMNNI